MNADGSSIKRLTTSSRDDTSPTWSPDGRRIAFASHHDRSWEIYVMKADGSGATRLTDDEAQDEAPTWSPDGQQIAFTSYRFASGEYPQIYIMDVDSETDD